MEIFLSNFIFIWINSVLALVAILFGWLMSKANSTFAKLWTGFLWLIFLPNTIYILTDISHLFEDWPKVGNLFKLILIFQYSLFAIFGIITFVISTYFFQRLLEGKRKKGIKTTTIIAICILNFIVGFGVVLGGIRRTNSWYIFTNPSRVLEDTLNVIYSQELLILSLGIGILANFIYFLMLESIATWGKKYLKK
ncbi:MAG: hypothetical protein A3H17_03880 [Candidatus Levybacteria bacterium RIFCSPLOWO2_12_FULL_37_14]|nr:MAG: hypothetical protein A3H17_03880 [Candidatus Levybacteria bacterium RIFCSPLOWO2_12_FULL_37_14]